MEIAPIPGTRAIGPARAQRTNSDLSRAFDINAVSKMGDNAAATRVNKAAGAEEDEDLDLSEDEESSAQDQPGVNYFA